MEPSMRTRTFIVIAVLVALFGVSLAYSAATRNEADRTLASIEMYLLAIDTQTPAGPSMQYYFIDWEMWQGSDAAKRMPEFTRNIDRMRLAGGVLDSLMVAALNGVDEPSVDSVPYGAAAVRTFPALKAFVTGTGPDARFTTRGGALYGVLNNLMLGEARAAERLRMKRYPTRPATTANEF